MKLGLALGLNKRTSGAGAPDTTAPVVNSSSYASGTQAVTMNVTEASGSATCYWALVTNPSTPTEAQVIAGTGGGILEAGSFTVTSGGDTDVISVSNEAGDELHLVLVDASGNSTGTPSGGNNTIITGVIVDSTAPTITAYSPADNATDVATDATISIVFNESMNTAAATTVTLKNVGGATIETFDSASDGTWSTTTNANDTWTVTPASEFVNEATLAVQYSGFKDLYGNTVTAVSDDTTWNWTVAAAGVTDIMSGIGDFASASGWSLDSGLTITGGVLDINTSSNFISASRNSTPNRIACPEGVTLSLEYDMVSLTTPNRIRIKLWAYDSGANALGSDTLVYDTSTDGAVTSGINSKASVYTTPAGTVSLQVTIEFTLSAFVGQMDNFKLTY